MSDLIERQAVLDLCESKDPDYKVIHFKEDVECLPSVKSCEDTISRTDAISVASGYCHWTNIPKELAKLPSVNPIPCDDAISRQVVLDGLEKYHDGADLHIDGLTYAYDLVCKLPSVSVAEKVGRWEWVQYDYNPKIGNWHCSECRSVVIECVNKEEKGGIPLYKYCPQCGARMVETQESW